MSKTEKVPCAEKGPITEELLQRMDQWFRAANYLSAGQLYLLENPLLRKPLTINMVKKEDRRPLGNGPRAELRFRAPEPGDQAL